MPLYVFESASGETLERPFPVSECPREVEELGVTFRKVVAPVSFRFGGNLQHVDKPDDEREATVQLRDFSEWQIAAGSHEFDHDKTETNRKVTDQLSVPTKDGIERKREALRHGAKPPPGIKVKE